MKVEIFPVELAGMKTKPNYRRPKRRGPEPLGDRVQFTVNFERDLLEAAEAIAEHDDLPVARIINRLVAEALGMPVPHYCLPKASNQEALPIDDAAAEDKGKAVAA